MMQILGIIVVVLMILAGLFLLFLKPRLAQPMASEENTIDPQSQQPIIPRHLRQLGDITNQKTLDEKPSEDLNAIKDDSSKHAMLHEDVSASSIEHKEQKGPDTVTNDLEISDRAIEELKLDFSVDDTISTEPEKIQEIKKVSPHELDISIEAQNFDINMDKESHHIDTVSMKALEEEQDWQNESALLEKHAQEQQKRDDTSPLSTAEFFLSLYLYPEANKLFSGKDVHDVLLKYSLKYGAMSCFHYYDASTENINHLAFSCLKLNSQNTSEGFDLVILPTETISGLIFFLALPHPQAIKSFDLMMGLVKLISEDLGANLYDENMRPLTADIKQEWKDVLLKYLEIKAQQNEKD